MAELLAPILDGADEETLRDHLDEHGEEMAALLRWSRIDDFDRAAVDHALHTHPDLGGDPA